MAPVHLILLLGSFLLNFDHFSSFSVGSPFTLREVSRNNVGTMDYAVQLNATNFNAALRDTPALFSMVEFYAHWNLQRSLILKRFHSWIQSKTLYGWG
ncbi:hypothetical protein CRG98_018227 [Punica granatum]|uniref:Uncharacterized protein n=1 Tax=Punica granatum TaxID=22663 RepID=A0A2I0JYG4_PUNGR|nr:hypothetical protein CRG98_018227 [Punica granatum]